jgi:hypothetical protein
MTKISDVRKERVLRICNICSQIFDKKEGIIKEKLIYNLCFEYGISKRTALEYILTAQHFLKFTEKEGIYYGTETKTAVAETL